MRNISVRAFSLLELSIVLVIIGLIAGGIVAGASMIRAAEIRSSITEASQFQTATNVFRDKYLGYPGDLKNAGDFWGYPGGSSSNCPSTGGTGTETCNGDSDGEIDSNTGSALDYTERFMFWQHLANAELIAGSYTGRTGSSHIDDHDLGGNAPQSKLSGAGWTIFRFGLLNGGNMSGDAGVFDGFYGNSLWLGLEVDGQAPNGYGMTATEAWNLDKKLDDGKPATGKIVTRYRPTCTVASDGSALTSSAAHAAVLDAEYDLADESVGCIPVIRNVF